MACGLILWGSTAALHAQAVAGMDGVHWVKSPVIHLLVLAALSVTVVALIVELLRLRRRRADRRPNTIAAGKMQNESSLTEAVDRQDVQDGRQPAPTPTHDEPTATIRVVPGKGSGLPQLGRFQLEVEIGRGAMGRVYRGIDTSNGQRVAVKTLALTREFTGYALTEARERFRREALAARRLSHPDIVQVLDAGEAHGLAYIAMELLHGSDLTRFTQARDRMAVNEVLSIGARVALALAHAHAQGVVHRDIKPANVMVDFAHDRVKVMDFGIARISDAARTRTGLVLGSPLYMSPEQLTGRPVDGRSDLYSLGVVLFQLLCGRLPTEAGSLAELMRLAVHQAAPSVLDLRPDLPRELADVIALALQKRVELRYSDGREMARDLSMIASRQLSTHPARRSEQVHEVAQSNQGRTTDDGARSGFVHNDQD